MFFKTLKPQTEIPSKTSVRKMVFRSSTMYFIRFFFWFCVCFYVFWGELNNQPLEEHKPSPKLKKIYICVLPKHKRAA